MKIKDLLIKTSLISFSSFLGFFIVNLFLIFYIRNTSQKESYSQSILPFLPVTARWRYPDIGQTYSKKDIALIGDSNIEGKGDALDELEYLYSLGHFLKQKTNLNFIHFGSAGTYPKRQLNLYDLAVNGNLWPLFDKLESENRPSTLILFFYEGNDLDDYYHYMNKDEKCVNCLIPKRVRYFPLLSFLKWSLDHSKNLTKIYIRNYFVEYENGPLGFLYRQFLKKEKKTILKTNIICNKNNCLEVGPLQSASSTLNQSQIEEGLKNTMKDIIHFRKKHPSRLCLVYLPSPATIYFLSNYSPDNIYFQKYQYGNENSNGLITREENLRRSLFMRSKFKAFSNQNNISFLDLTKSLSESANEKYLHGVKDSKHFSKMGYSIVAQKIVESGLKCIN